MLKLLLLFIGLPLLELALLIEVGSRIGVFATLGLVFFTGILGAWLARRQGLGVLSRMREETAKGRLPAGSIVDGVIILLAAAVLMTPGMLTDAFGFFCLIPAGRALIKRSIWERLKRAVSEGDVQVRINVAGDWEPPPGPRRDPTKLPSE